VNNLAQYLTDPRPTHIQTLKRTMRYIKGTLTLGIRYQQSTNGNVLYGYSNVDWVGDQDTRRSASGYYFYLAGSVISWGIKKQQFVALFSTESKYMALAKTTAEVVWLRKLLSELEFSQPNSTTIYSNNQSAISLSENPKYHSRNKHVETQYHFTREKVLDKQMQLRYISTFDMIELWYFHQISTKRQTHQMYTRLKNGFFIPQYQNVLIKHQALITFYRPHF